MTERLSHELASLLAEDDGGLDRGEAQGLLRARLARSISEGLGQVPREHDLGEAGTIDRAQVAAYLDCSGSPAERDAIAVRLTHDPVVRAEMAAAVWLLSGVQARPETIPAGLVARAVGILAAARPVGAQVPARVPIAIWSRPAATWSALAAVLLVAVSTPAVVSMIRDGNEAPTLPDAKGAPVSRGVVPSPEGKGKDARSCDDLGEPAKSQHPRSREGAAKAPDRSAQSPSAALDDDPCRPKPADEDARKP
jgi:hypothetical protein